jgi:hypothetical protein
MPIMPVKLNTTISYFDGPPVVSCATFCIRDGKLTEPVDAFDHPFWDRVRDHVADKAMDMRRQGFFGAAMLPMNELWETAPQLLKSLVTTASKPVVFVTNRVLLVIVLVVILCRVKLGGLHNPGYDRFLKSFVLFQ